ncbi:Core-2/I-Branching enzyme [Elizabethkingia miricola]|nr:Core-2/I-Branching enzyme [Elizabethkingia miricola]
MSKHAYLIIAHHEFAVLKLLLQALDDSYNDIYIHFDKKVKELPLLKCEHSTLFILENRINIHWGTVSQIESEYVLFEEAYKNAEQYSRYHLISGVHFPIKKQKEIRVFFEKYENKEILNFLNTNSYETNMKLGRYHFFLKNYKSPSLKGKLSQFFWHVLLKLQYIFRINKTEPKVTAKANNWVSLTSKSVELLIQEKQKVLKEFEWSFCGDEYFVPYVLGNHPEKCEVINDERLLFNEFVRSSPRILTDEDYNFLIQSEYLFARKFSEANIVVVERILKHLKSE